MLRRVTIASVYLVGGEVPGTSSHLSVVLVDTGQSPDRGEAEGTGYIGDGHRYAVDCVLEFVLTVYDTLYSPFYSLFSLIITISRYHHYYHS